MVKLIANDYNDIQNDKTTTKIKRRNITKKNKGNRKKATSTKLNLQILEENTHVEKEVYLQKVHQEFKKINLSKPNATNRQVEYLYEKMCEKCTNIHADDLLLLCDICDDGYHIFCLEPPLEKVPPEDEDWICPPCLELKKRKEEENQKSQEKIKNLPKQRQSTLHDYFENTIKPIIQECHACYKPIDDNPPLIEENNKKYASRSSSQQKVLSIKQNCIKCKNVFHAECFNRKTKKTILCKACEANVKAELPKNEVTLLKFFTAAIKNKSTQSIKNPNENANTTSNYSRLSSPIKISEMKHSKRKGYKRVNTKKKKPIFKLPKIMDPQNKFQLKKTLAFALLSKGITFDDDLCFSNLECPPSKNDATLEPNLQKMNKENIKIFMQFKEMSRNGDYIPVIIEEDIAQGFIVKATEDIADLTLISEYVGEVDFARNRLFDPNDSIMDLLRTNHSKYSLVICPETRGNLARFLSGINNYDKNSKAKQNVKSIRFNVDGHARVILYACRNIKKDEILYYDYNAGGFDEYPTENFIQPKKKTREKENFLQKKKEREVIF